MRARCGVEIKPGRMVAGGKGFGRHSIGLDIEGEVIEMPGTVEMT